MAKIFCLLALCCLAGACGSGNEKKQATASKNFQMIEVPSILDNPDDRAAYIGKNYWRNFDFTDTSLIGKPEITEQAFADYVHIIEHMNAETAAASVKTTLSKAEADTAMYAHFLALFEKYLYDPNSPMRNETLYITVLRVAIGSPKTSEAEKTRMRYRLDLAQRNRPEMPATDFTYTLASGKTGTLYDIDAEYLILFFNNPGCHACQETIDQINGSETVRKMIGDKRLKVLSVYPDEDMKAWKEYFPTLPTHWLNGYDASQQIKNEELYDLRAIPTLYLIDRKKFVILKDAPFGEIEHYLTQKAEK
ncbi:DUF5106 domain-containing protein [Alistipes sp. dk3620]|uniref:DUF5106 domain-containing protein n=1 Tax=unclassified Alistipes TaxID=2608932 RepID=UPI001297AE13|nr:MULTISPECIES: DUF5106 domain-containing protein [unclassified Alistipes]MQX27717.1 DUF5106 domain-containing protein [Alistipes sp. dk3620]QGA23100.1 DUF5106 domain-containing protein [Alistipes sp. dk3624]HIV60259.1 DUF5106 domain-containing protein [Candidatus Alistipes pullistercoris]